MAFAKHFKSRFFSADGNAYQIWLDEEGFGGSITDILGRGDPLTLDWGRRGIDIFSPVRGSKAKIRLWRQPDNETVLEDLLKTASDQYRVRVVNGTSQSAIEGGTWDLYWQGFLMLDAYQDSTIKLPDQLDLEAIDGVSKLKSIPYTDTSGMSEVAFTGRDNLKDVFVRIMNKLGHGLPFSMVSRTFADSVAKTVDPWANMEVDNGVYYDGNGSARDCYFVLKDILYRMNAIGFQRGGRWWALDLAVVDGSDYTVYEYDSTGSATGTTTDGASIDISTGVSNGSIFREPGHRTFRQPIGMTQIRYNHGIVPSLIKAGDFEDQFLRGGRGDTTTGDDPNTEWSITGPGTSQDPVIRDASGQRYDVTRGGRRGIVGRGGPLSNPYYTGNAVAFIPAFFHGTSRDNDTVKTAVRTDNRFFNQQGENVAIGDKIAFTGRVRIPHNAGDGFGRFMTYWLVGISGTDYVLQADGSWDNSVVGIDDKMQYIVDPRDEWGDGGLFLDTWYDFEFLSEAVPAAGAIFVRLWGTSDIDGSDLDPEGVEWDDINISLVDENAEIVEASLTQVWTGDAEKDRDIIDVEIGPGPTDFMESRVTWAGTEETDFESDLISPAVDFDQLTAETWLRFLNRFLEQRFETYKNLNYEYGKAVSIGSDVYFPTYVSKSVRHARDRVEFVIHSFDAADTVTVGSFGDSEQTFVRSGGTSSASPGSSQSSGDITDLAQFLSTHNPIALLGADYADGDVVTELTVQSVTDAGLMSGDDVVVVDLVNGAFERFQMSANETDVTWDVEDPNSPGNGLTLANNLASGSGVYFANDELLSIVFGNITPVTTKGDLIAGDASGDEERLGVGTDGQHLEADSSAPLGVAWKDKPSQYTSPITTKGDLFVGGSGGGDDRLPVGNDNDILVSDAAQAKGLKWEDNGFDGELEGVTDTDGNPKRLTIVNGRIVTVADPPPSVTDVFYTTDPAGTDAEIRKLTV